MPISRDEVLHIARLAHLEFTDAEYDRFTRQLSRILDYIAQLEGLDTSAVEPTSQVGDHSPGLRDDRVQGSIRQETALANAPDAGAGLFRVPRVIG